MNTRDIMKALLEGKKVGASPYRYMFLNLDGELVISCEDPEGFSDSEILGSLFMWEVCKVLPEDGP